MNSFRTTTAAARLLLLFILILGASLRLLWVRAPLLEAHRWRQVDTAAIARNLYEGPFNVFRPQIDWGGRNGAVESEFPLLPAMVAVENTTETTRPRYSCGPITL